MKMPFGKYKGQNVEDIPVDYIRWLLTNTDVDKNDPTLAQELQNQLDLKEGRGISRKPR